MPSPGSGIQTSVNPERGSGILGVGDPGSDLRRVHAREGVRALIAPTTDANERHMWERSLREEIFDSNAILRRDGQFDGAEIKYEPIRKEAQGLGIDPDRALRIAVAATSDFDWAEAVDSMVRENVSQEYAEKIAEKISLQISSTRSLRDHSLEFYWDRIKLRLSCMGLACFAAGVVLVVVYWTPIWVTVGSVAQCIMGGTPL